MKLWLKVYKDGKIVSHTVVSNDLPMKKKNYEQSVIELFRQLNIDCPLQLDMHFKHIEEFNMAKYAHGEFLTEQDFDFATVENILEEEEYDDSQFLKTRNKRSKNK